MKEYYELSNDEIDFIKRDFIQHVFNHLPYYILKTDNIDLNEKYFHIIKHKDYTSHSYIDYNLTWHEYIGIYKDRITKIPLDSVIIE
tara:strand:+ start:290 stop:550 length:261 start_codon:yes stop_codon:yes gene_type:complete